MSSPRYVTGPGVPVTWHDMDSKQVEAALVDVILERMREDRWTAAEMQRRTNVKSRSWHNYFKSRERAVPLATVYAIAEVLGTSGSELMHAAEERARPKPASSLAEHVIAQLSPEAQAQVREAQRIVAERPDVASSI